MIELKVDKFADGIVVFHISRQDVADYERLQKQSCSFEINGTNFFIESGVYPGFYSDDKQFFVRGELTETDFDRIIVSISEYLIIFELIKKYNETCFDF